MTMLSPAGRILAALFVAVTLAACTTLGGTGLVASTVTTELTPEAATAISGDMVGRLAEQGGPGSTTNGATTDGAGFGRRADLPGRYLVLRRLRGALRGPQRVHAGRLLRRARVPNRQAVDAKATRRIRIDAASDGTEH